MNYNPPMTPSNSPELIRIGTKRLPRFKAGRSGQSYWNAGVNAFASSRGVARSRRPASITNYYNAGVQTAYGNLGAAKAELGDLFNDVMGSFIPGWDQRSPELKNIKVKLDPAKLMTQAQKLLSPAQAQRAAEMANQYGVSGTYRGVDMTPERIRAAYQAGGVMAAVSEVPMMWWVTGLGGAAALYYFAKYRP